MDAAMLASARALLIDCELACADAHELAEKAGISPYELGEQVDGAGIRIGRCQLGLFGYGPKPEGKSKIVLSAARIPEEIGADIMARANGGRISCLDAWEVARRHKYPRLGIANVIEALGLKVKPCQLGCF